MDISWYCGDDIALKYDAVLWDLDGTLTESEPGIVNSVKYALEKMGAPEASDDQLRSFIGPPLYESFVRVGMFGDEDAKKAVELYRERFSVVGWKENSVYPGIPAILRALKKHGAYVAVATAKPDVFATRIIEYFGLAPYIDHIEAISLKNHHASKGEIVSRALPEKYTRACMIGDRDTDIIGAKENGIDGIGALYGYGSREELESAGAYAIADTPDDLWNLLFDDEEKAEGLFVTFEGSDGCGKSTQARLAAKWLKDCGYDVVTTREPGGCPISERIREIILDVKSVGMTDECEALLYAAARAQHVKTVIEPAVKRGAIVICDRFVDSSVAYQGAGRGLGKELVRRINEPAVQGRMPGLTLMYDLPPMKAMQRRLAASEPDRMELEKQAFVERVYQGYMDIAKEEADRVVLIDGDRPIEEIELDTRRALIGRIAEIR